MDKKLLRSVREYKKQSFLTPVLVAAEVFVEVLIPLLMAKIIDVGIMNGDMAYIIKLGALLVLLAVVALFFGAKAGQLAAVASSGYAKNLRHDIFYKIQDFSFGNIDHFSTPGLVTRLTTDITNVQMAYMFTIRLLARAPIMIVMSLIMTVTISPAIAFMMLITIPVLGGLLIFIAKKAHPHFIKVFDEYDELNNVVQENVNAARVVKAYVREDHEVEKFGKISGIVFRLFTKAEKIVAWNSPTMQFTMYIVVLAMVLIGGAYHFSKLTPVFLHSPFYTHALTSYSLSRESRSLWKHMTCRHIDRIPFFPCKSDLACLTDLPKPLQIHCAGKNLHVRGMS